MIVEKGTTAFPPRTTGVCHHIYLLLHLQEYCLNGKGIHAILSGFCLGLGTRCIRCTHGFSLSRNESLICSIVSRRKRYVFCSLLLGKAIAASFPSLARLRAVASSTCRVTATSGTVRRSLTLHTPFLVSLVTGYASSIYDISPVMFSHLRWIIPKCLFPPSEAIVL